MEVNTYPCADFAPDSLGEDPEVCSGCLWYADSHTTPFAYGWSDGFAGLSTGMTFHDDPNGAASVAYDRGRTQGEIDKARAEEPKDDNPWDSAYARP